MLSLSRKHWGCGRHGGSRFGSALNAKRAPGRSRLQALSSAHRHLHAPTRHSTPKVDEEAEFDVVIIGSGPVGCTFARKLVDGGAKVAMVDAGPRTSVRPGEHLKNAYKYQRDVNAFASHIRGALHTLSVPTNFSAVPTLDPLAYNPSPSAQGYIRGNQNPYQSPHENLPAAAATYAVGGMATHWTCACPRPTDIERNWLFPGDSAYQEAETLLRVNQKSFMHHSVRDKVLNKVLRRAWVDRTNAKPDLIRPGAKYPDGPQPLPIAGIRNKNNPEVMTWTGPDVVLGDELIKMVDDPSSRFTLLDNHVCKFLEFTNANMDTVEAAYVHDALGGKHKRLHAKMFVLAAGTVLTPQVIWASLHRSSSEAANEKLPALGRYLTEQPMAFCQVVWREDHMREFAALYPEFNASEDPVPIPINDPEPNQWLPVTPERPWHAQIHRDAFAYGDTAPNVDTRMIVDLRFFGIVQQRAENRVEFAICEEHGITDFFGLPQPTFHYKYSPEERLQMHNMMTDMAYYAGCIGGYLPGSEPQFVKPGLTLHIHGSTRVGESADDSVVNSFSEVHGVRNLVLGGNGLIPKAIACNPTLTSVAYALEASARMLKKLNKQARFEESHNGTQKAAAFHLTQPALI